MKKHLYLMPVMALSLATFALAGCDDKKEDNAAEATTAESTLPAADDTATTQTVAETSVLVSDARAYATAPGATTGAIFATLNNPTQEPDFLSGAKTDIASDVEIHQSYSDPQTGVMQMRPTSGVDIGAGQSVALEANGYHIMLMGLTKPLTPGESFNVTLTFRKAGDIVVPVTVVAPGADTPSAATTDMTPGAEPTSLPEHNHSAEQPDESLSGDEEGMAPSDADSEGATTGTMDSTGAGSTSTAPEGSATIPNDPAAQ